MNIGLLTSQEHLEQAQVRTEGAYGIVSSFSSIAEEYAAIRGSVAIFDFSTHGSFKVSGDEHVAWVASLVSRDLEFVNSETVTFALCLNETADVLGIVSLYKQDNSIIIETETADRDRLAAWFEEHRAEGIKIEDMSERIALIGIEGPAAFKVVQTLLDYEISAIPFQGFVETTYQGETLLLARTGYTGEYGYKVVAPTVVARQLWDELYARVREMGGRQCGAEALATTMLEVRQPIGGVETEGLPVIAAGLGWLVDFNKGDDYIGKEAIQEQAAAPHQERTIGFIVDGHASIKRGDPVVLEEQTIGKVITSFYSPTLNAQLGLALNSEPFTVPGLTWETRNEQGEVYEAHSVSSPYLVPRSWKIKML